jgi:hypothetical protein
MLDFETALDAERIKLRSDSYGMSIGELASLYEARELQIRPEFQRLRRWSAAQKNAFIESVLLQFPLPSIFVAARADGTWDLLDGLQRVTTIFEFMGILKESDEDEKAQVLEPFKLRATVRLPQLGGYAFDGDDDSLLPQRVRIDFRRQRMDVKIILRESDDDMLYDLFDRLNFGGTPLSRQDVRRAFINRRDSAFGQWMDELVRDPRYVRTLTLSDSDLSQGYDRELLLLFLILANDDDEMLATVHDVDETLTGLAKTAGSRLYEYDRDGTQQLFETVFGELDARLGPKAFENPDRDATNPGVGLSRQAFVVITAAIVEGVRSDRVGAAIANLPRYWRVGPSLASFSEMVSYGRQLLNG